MSKLSQEQLMQYKIYDASQIKNIIPFMRSVDCIDGIQISLGNMCSGYPFKLLGTDISFYNSETAYIAGLFSNDNDIHRNIQQQLMVCQNGFNAKKTIRKDNEMYLRNDFSHFNIMWMLYVVWSKCRTNEDFCNLLMSLPDDAVIVENSFMQNSQSATLWGCKNNELFSVMKQEESNLIASGLKKEKVYHMLNEIRLSKYRNYGTFYGCNVMGKILMICKRCLKTDIECPVDYDLLKRYKIYINGTLMFL